MLNKIIKQFIIINIFSSIMSKIKNKNNIFINMNIFSKTNIVIFDNI